MGTRLTLTEQAAGKSAAICFCITSQLTNKTAYPSSVPEGMTLSPALIDIWIPFSTDAGCRGCNCRIRPISGQSQLFRGKCRTVSALPDQPGVDALVGMARHLLLSPPPIKIACRFARTGIPERQIVIHDVDTGIQRELLPVIFIRYPVPVI